MSTAAVFVDRDGVINQLVPDPISGRPESPLTESEVRLIDGAAGALASLAGRGWTLVGVSNQPAAAKARISLEQLYAVQDLVLELLASAGARLDAFELCIHHPEGLIPELSGGCDCRKPAPGMLLKAASDLDLDLAASWMVGDTDADILAGQAAGCRTALVVNPDSAHKRASGVVADLEVDDLAAFAERILRANK